MNDCRYCATRAHIYQADCESCTVRHLARGTTPAIAAAVDAVEQREGFEAAKAYRERIKVEYRLDRGPGGLYGGQR